MKYGVGEKKASLPTVARETVKEKRNKGTNLSN